jgi:hypothetical protein
MSDLHMDDKMIISEERGKVYTHIEGLSSLCNLGVGSPAKITYALCKHSWNNVPKINIILLKQ